MLSHFEHAVKMVKLTKLKVVPLKLNRISAMIAAASIQTPNFVVFSTLRLILGGLNEMYPNKYVTKLNIRFLVRHST